MISRGKNTMIFFCQEHMIIMVKSWWNPHILLHGRGAVEPQRRLSTKRLCLGGTFFKAREMFRKNLGTYCMLDIYWTHIYIYIYYVYVFTYIHIHIYTYMIMMYMYMYMCVDSMQCNWCCRISILYLYNMKVQNGQHSVWIYTVYTGYNMILIHPSGLVHTLPY